MSIRSKLETQLDEMEMIQSIFSQPGEFREDRDSCHAVMAFAKKGYNFNPPPLVYSLNLTVDDVKLEVNFTFPKHYPSVKPNVYLRDSCTSLNGTLNVSELTKGLKEYMTTLRKGEICVYQLIVWLQDNVKQYVTSSETTEPVGEIQIENNTSLSRYWIYTHHIYSNKKRKDILDLASKAELTGFVLPGRPGIICLEGLEEDCHNTWIAVKSMNWQKIALKAEEKDCPKPRKFSTFKEVCFEGYSDRHMDMGKFLTFLKERECEHVFKEYFGCDGQSIDNA